MKASKIEVPVDLCYPPFNGKMHLNVICPEWVGLIGLGYQDFKHIKELSVFPCTTQDKTNFLENEIFGKHKVDSTCTDIIAVTFTPSGKVLMIEVLRLKGSNPLTAVDRLGAEGFPELVLTDSLVCLSNRIVGV